ncbi:hypothetical protein LWI28_001561 [Acer negundo]|uniref:Uncharacterized protein n=1 Tax=Acer negundo TaxID=4023 RepID=A0AAD5IBL6_ACENE|nr:hypothetical protein LWI28_001561 [Acer negundo]
MSSSPNYALCRALYITLHVEPSKLHSMSSSPYYALRRAFQVALRWVLNIMDGPRRAGQRVAARGARGGRTGRCAGAGRGAGVGQ